MTDALLYFEDLAVGQTFRSPGHAIDADAIKNFARAFDPQPFHLDEELARMSLFGGLAASGWHTAALTMRLMVESVAIAGGVIGVGGEIAWPRPTRPGDILTVDTEVVALIPSRSHPDRGRVTIESRTRNQHGELVQTLKVGLVVPRRPAS